MFDLEIVFAVLEGTVNKLLERRLRQIRLLLQHKYRVRMNSCLQLLILIFVKAVSLQLTGLTNNLSPFSVLCLCYCGKFDT